MSDERKGWLLKHVDYVFNECRKYIESKDNDCLNCLEGAETCYQVYEEIKRLIQQKPEIDEKYVNEKLNEFMKSLSHLSNVMSSVVYRQIKITFDKFIRQIIKDVKGGK